MRNFAVLLNSSKDLQNYRHTSNIYHLRQLLIDNSFKDSEILFLLAENPIFDIKNIKKGRAYSSDKHFIDVEDIKSKPFTVNTFLNILMCNHPMMRRLNENDNVLVYMCGHGGLGFLKFHDREYLLKMDLVNGIKKLSKRVRYVLLILDTCQAESLVDELPENVITIATSEIGEPSLSKNIYGKIGVAVIDLFMKILYKRLNGNVNENLNEFFKDFAYDVLGSHIRIIGKHKDIKLHNFFVQTTD